MRTSILVLALLWTACNRPPTPKPTTAPARPSMPTAQAGQTVAGKVLERIDASSYSYLRLDTLGGEQWAAVPKCLIKTGESVVVAQAMPMDGFESKTLNRKFEHIVFGVLQGTTAPSAPAAAPVPGSPHAQAGAPHGKPAAAPADVGPIAVPRATGAGAATVAEVFENKASLKDKPVRVHAKVVKVLPNIMGKNWMHLRDGSGSEDKKNNDLTVTTDDVATVGSVVLVEGTVHTDKDLGSGYNFSVLIEDAKVTKD